jgi:hypothetical protein
MKAVNIEVLTGPQGGGKSKVMREEAIANAGRYLFALPTHELIIEQVQDFLRAAQWLETISVYSVPNKGRTADRLTKARLDFEARQVGHCVIFTTHATLMDHPLEGFDGWHVRIDEAPASVQAGRFNIAVSGRPWLKETFDLVGAPENEWSALKLKIAKPDWQAVGRDAGAKPLSEFVKQASQPDRVFIKATSWDATDDIEWFSMWTPLSLSRFASVQVAGSSYTESVGFKAAKSLFSDLLAVKIREIAERRKGQPAIDIYFFTRGHEGTTTFWKTSPGRLMVKQVCDCLGKKMPKTGFWSGNEIVEILMDHRLKAKFIKPLAMGLNKHRTAKDCAFIYSAKATGDDTPVMEVFKLTEDDIRHAREDDAIAQFAMRGAIRNIEFGDAYAIYLYSESQAERLRDHLLKIGFTNVELVALDEAGIMDENRPKAGRKPPTAEQKAAKEEARRLADTERKKAQRGDKAEAEGRVRSANNGRGGRPAGRTDKAPRKPRAGL